MVASQEIFCTFEEMLLVMEFNIGKIITNNGKAECIHSQSISWVKSLFPFFNMFPDCYDKNVKVLLKGLKEAYDLFDSNSKDEKNTIIEDVDHINKVRTANKISLYALHAIKVDFTARTDKTSLNNEFQKNFTTFEKNISPEYKELITAVLELIRKKSDSRTTWKYLKFGLQISTLVVVVCYFTIKLIVSRAQKINE
jgi:hypothetical protein